MPQNPCPQSVAGINGSGTGCAQVGQAAYVVGNLTRHGGPVMHSVTNYAIFWLPAAYHFDTPALDRQYPNASDMSYESLIGQYFRDLSNTAYYSILQQYTDSTGAPGTTTSFGGSWVDTSQYPNSEGSRANPLQDSDIEAEVSKAMSANGWSAANGNNIFFVFTGDNVYGCAGSSCSYNAYCAYHSAFQASNGQVVVYADIPDPGSSSVGSCLATAASGFAAPNSGAFADSAVNLAAHEGFESVTDPILNGWYYQDSDHEIGDECAWRFGSVSSDGSNIALNGHGYLVQEMWSNTAGGCFIPPTVPTLSVVASYQVQGGPALGPPIFTYFSGGVLQKTVLSTTPQTLSVDLGTAWSVTGTLAGSTQTERWQTGQLTSGILRFSGTFTFTYYHQYLIDFGFGVVGGGSGYSPPSITLTQFGYQASATASTGGLGVWVDAQSRYNYTAVLPASGPNERWMAQTGSGTVASSSSVTLQYYHQYLVPFSYVGGGDTSSRPVLSYSSLGGTLGAPLGLQPQSFWLDAGAVYSATNPLPGSTATDRWYATRGSGTVSSAGAIQLAYYHQYLVSVQGGAAASGWFNSSSQATITTPVAFARNSGVGSRVTGYQVDGGPLQPVALTTDKVSVVLQMSGPHIVDFASIAQYQVSLDSGASVSLLSITPPTVPGDSYWYDSGSTVTLMLNSVWGRDSSSGSRLASYSTDGGAPAALTTTGPVSVLQSVQVSSPHTITTVVVTQYHLSTAGGSVQSLTNPSIPSDIGWYDGGTKVVASYNNAWNETQGSRMSALGINLDGVGSQLSRSGTGTFQTSIVMDKAHMLEVVAVMQYRLTVTGGSAVSVAPQSPTGDAFYDVASTVSVSSARIWDAAALTREALVSYSLDGGSNQRLVVPFSDTGSFSTPTITFDRPLQVAFGSAAQYLVALRFTDATGSKVIVPTALEIGASQSNATVPIQGSKAWLDSGSSFVVKQLLWENVDVKPLNQVVSVTAPQNVTIAARVYDATLRVSDYLQVPISGASAFIQLANGSSLSKTTASDGTVSLASIPLGRFNATVTYLGVSQGVNADVASQKTVDMRLPLSLPDLGAVAGIIVVALASYVVLRRRRNK